MFELNVFVDALFLVTSDSTGKYIPLVKELISVYEEVYKAKGNVEDQELIRFYVSILKSIIDGEVDLTDKNAIVKVILSCKTKLLSPKFEDIGETLSHTFMDRGEEDLPTDATLESMEKNIKTSIHFVRLNMTMRKNWGRISRAFTYADKLRAISQCKVELEQIVDYLNETQVTTVNSPKPTGSVHLTDLESLEKALIKSEKRSTHGVIHSGLQGLNRALGTAGGLLPGESMCYCALSHHGKSLSILSWALWATDYKTNVGIEEGKKPAVLFISLENEEQRILMDIFKIKYQEIEGKDPSELNRDEIKNWIYNYFAQKPIQLFIERYDTDFDMEKYRSLLDSYESRGYQIILVCLDYMACMKVKNEAMHLGLLELSTDLVNEARTRGFAFVTGHQLNRDAEKLAMVHPLPVKYYGQAHLHNSSAIFQPFDIMCFQHKVVVDSTGHSFMTYHIGKHRHVNTTPDTHKFFCYQFKPNGLGIEDDVGKEPKYISDPYTYDLADPDQVSLKKEKENSDLNIDILSTF